MPAKKQAVEAEATNTTVRDLEFKGKTYRVDTNADNWSLDTMLNYESGKSIGVISAMLGDVQWQKFLSTKPTNKDFAELAEAVFELLGVEQGE